VSDLLRGEEILACVHKVALTRGAPFDFDRSPSSPEMEKRRRDAESLRNSVLNEIAANTPGTVEARSVDETEALMLSGAEVILRPRLRDDIVGKRRANVNILVRVGRENEKYIYAPVLVKNNEIIETAVTRRILEGSLTKLQPGDATYTNGVGPRSNQTVQRNGIVLAHATRVLQSLGHGDASARVGMIDRNHRLWWFELNASDFARFNLSTYEEFYQQRLNVLNGHEKWLAGEGEFPTKPFWHRECLDCEFASHCEPALQKIDDVSLTRFSKVEEQLALHELGIDTRAQLARLDPKRARQAKNKVLNPTEQYPIEDYLAKSVEKLDDLIYRARAHVRGSYLRIVDADKMSCPTADVEVDIDMESYDDATYLWGASVTLNAHVEGIEPGYRAFVEWGELTGEAEAKIFQEFWQWLSDLREKCAAQSLTIAGYCFWAQAEDGAMNRAVENPLPGGPTPVDLQSFRSQSPAQWIDMHDIAKQQIQTEGPLGLKQLAVAAGFHWRDENPSGEASMLWYEVARNENSQGNASRQRLLEYNEDDCRATKALRDWLNDGAKSLPHRDDPL
jgi:predicted RecB family nuclease